MKDFLTCITFLFSLKLKTKSARRWSNKWTKTLYQDYRVQAVSCIETRGKTNYKIKG